ncbi:MAG: polysaccharide deacetylase family protein [bacterium]|nr:polysaccharide deacetylase family protein [bacterium]
MFHSNSRVTLALGLAGLLLLGGCVSDTEVSRTVTTQLAGPSSPQLADAMPSVGALDAVPPRPALEPTSQPTLADDPSVNDASRLRVSQDQTEQAAQEVPEITDEIRASGRDFLNSLTEEFHYVMASKIDELIWLARSWNPQVSVSIAVELPDGSTHGFVPQESHFSASSAKPYWAAAALANAEIAAIQPFGAEAIVASNNFAAGQLIDLAGGVDAVNNWTTNVARLRETRLEAWRFGDENRVASNFDPENPLGNRTSTSDLARFYARLIRGQLLDSPRTAVLRQWLRGTSRSLAAPNELGGVLLDRLPQQVAAASLHKGGWLPPGCCAGEYRHIVDAGVVVLPGGGWFSLAVLSTQGEYFDQSVRWVSLAACRIYSLIVSESGIVEDSGISADVNVNCNREGDGVHSPAIWPIADTTGGGSTSSGSQGGAGLRDGTAQNPSNTPSNSSEDTSSNPSGNAQPVMYLTFDDGPHPIYTPQVLDVLETYGVRATFFVLGSLAENYPGLIQRILDEGHTIGNHTWNHEQLGKLTRVEFDETVGRTEDILGSNGVNCLRPPHGSLNEHTNQWAAAHGLRVMTWDFSPQDWIPQSPTEIANKIVANARDGVNILLHDGGGDRSSTIAGLEIALEELAQRGFRYEAACV